MNRTEAIKKAWNLVEAVKKEKGFMHSSIYSLHIALW